MTAAICPNCGYDITADVPLECAGISMQPYGRVTFNGAAVTLTRGESGILWALMKADRALLRPVLAERIGYEGDAPGNIVDVLLCRIKHKLGPHGAVPIRNIRGLGLYIEDAA